ncbi:MAG TPA: hypothetical protein VE890_10490, partial [Thermoguttaceae bacterium]|nr:hypothetical protein [Thermoguttaceae bacterium]
MSESRQRWLVLFVSLSLTALLLGAVGGAVIVWQKTRDQLRDPEFLHRQLAIVEPSNDDSQLEKAPPPVRVGVAKVQPIRPETSVIGRLIEVRKVTVSSETTGKILEMPVEIGTPVIGNETLLVRVDESWSRLAVRRYEALVAVAQAQLEYHRGELLRSERLSERTAVTESEMELRRASVDEWTARLAEANASLDEENERVLRAAVL